MRYKIVLCRKKYHGLRYRHFIVSCRLMEGAQFREIGFAPTIAEAYNVISGHIAGRSEK